MSSFKSFLAEVKENGSHLFLVGDILDYWIAYPSVIPSIFFKVLVELYAVRKAGVQVTYLQGNHDFNLGEFFDKEMDIKTVEDFCEVTLYNKTFLITHGDRLLPASLPYRLIRSTWCQKLYRLVHPTLGLWLMKKVSRRSYETSDKGKHKQVLETMRKRAEQLAHQRSVNYIVCGHNHSAEKTSFTNKSTYVNLGCWLNISCLTYGVFDGTDFYLKNR